MEAFEQLVIDRNKTEFGLTENLTRSIYLQMHRGEYVNQATREWFEFFSAGVEKGRHDDAT